VSSREQGVSRREQSVKLDVSTTEGGRQAALMTQGPLEGDVKDGKACFWVAAEGGSTHSIVWPAGSQARIDPLRVVDKDGAEVAKVGDRALVIGGSPLFPDRPGCHAGSSTWLASSVRRAL
jgi:hypothetical protein